MLHYLPLTGKHELKNNAGLQEVTKYIFQSNKCADEKETGCKRGFGQLKLSMSFF